MVNQNNPQIFPTYDVESSVVVKPPDYKLSYPADYADFRTADPYLQSILPRQIPYGITSPGTIHMETDCTGLDFVDTNPVYDKLPFSVCLNKFNEQYRIPESVFNNFMNSLPYTFSALSDNEKKRHLLELKKFVENLSESDNSINRSINKTKKVAHYENPNYGSRPDSLRSNVRSSGDDCGDGKINIYNTILFVSVIIILLIIGIIYITNNN